MTRNGVVNRLRFLGLGRNSRERGSLRYYECENLLSRKGKYKPRAGKFLIYTSGAISPDINRSDSNDPVTTIPFLEILIHI